MNELEIHANEKYGEWNLMQGYLDITISIYTNDKHSLCKLIYHSHYSPIHFHSTTIIDPTYPLLSHVSLQNHSIITTIITIHNTLARDGSASNKSPPLAAYITRIILTPLCPYHLSQLLPTIALHCTIYIYYTHNHHKPPHHYLLHIYNPPPTRALCVETGDLKPALGPGFTGIHNLGNSCYMNSLMQVLFSIPDFIKEFVIPLFLPEISFTSIIITYIITHIYIVNSSSLLRFQNIQYFSSFFIRFNLFHNSRYYL